MNHNAFFENLAGVSTEARLDTEEICSEIAASVSDETSPMINNESAGTSAHLLKLLISKVNVMLEHMVRLEVKIDNIQSSSYGPNDATGMVNVAMLNKLGLPVKSLNELKSLEDSLNEDIKRVELVRYK